MLGDVIDTIYEAAFVAEQWPTVLDRMATLSVSMGAAMFLFAEGRPTRGVALESQRAQLEEFLASDTLPFSTSVQRVCQSQPASFVDFDAMLTPDERENDLVNQHYRSQGIGNHLGTSIAMPSGELVIFVHQRRLAHGPYEPGQVERLDQLRPHLSRASLMAVKLGLERAKGAVESMELMGLPAAVLTASGHVQVTNALFNSLDSVFVSTAFGGLAIADAVANRLWQQIIQASMSGREPLSRSIPLIQRDNRAPMIIHFLPLRRTAHDLFFGGDLLLAVTTLNSSAFVPSPNVLSGLFDLTSSEAKLAIALAAGHSLKQAAIHNKIKVSTARFYLEQVFQKTGTHQQSELVALLKSAQPFQRAGV
jgi:DNA-binding CsgD family transcriptional regulator